MRLFVVSDTHCDFAILHKCMARHQADVTYWYHLGDSEVPPEFIQQDFVGVRGNCDHYEGLPYTRDIVFPFGTIHLEHGHMISGNIQAYIKATGRRIFLSGHTHVKLAKLYEDGIWQFNPGSLVRPRDGMYGSYLLIDVDRTTGKVYHYEFHLVDTLMGTEVEGGKAYTAS